MTQLRYIAMVPIVDIRRDEYGIGQVQRDAEGRPIYIGWRLHHNAKLYEQPGRARHEANAFVRNEEGMGRVLEVDLDELPEAPPRTVDQEYQFAERQMLRWTAEHGRLFDIVHGKMLDKSDRDYHERVKRNAEWRAHATTELRRLLEMFKPPEYVIDVRRDVNVSGRWSTDKDGKFYQDADRVWPFVVTLKDARLGTDRHEEASDAHVFTCGETEGAAYASMLETLLAGRGFYPGA